MEEKEKQKDVDTMNRQKERLEDMKNRQMWIAC